jgi:Flp pilus assembly pilin Flp
MSRAQLRGDVQRESTNGGAATPTTGRASCVAALRFIQQIRIESAQTMAEYAVVLGVLTLIVVAALTLLATSAANELSRVASYLNF